MIESFLEKGQENDKTERARGLGRKTRWETEKENQTTALNFAMQNDSLTWQLFCPNNVDTLLTEELTAGVSSFMLLLLMITFIQCNHMWLAFYSTFCCCCFFISTQVDGVAGVTALAWLVPHKNTAVSAHSVYTIQPCTASRHTATCIRCLRV